MLTEEQKAHIRAQVKDCPLKKPKVPENELKVATEQTLSYEEEVRRAERIRLRQERIRKEEEEREHERVYQQRRQALEIHQGMQEAIMNAQYEAKQRGSDLGAYDPFARFQRQERGWDND